MFFCVNLGSHHIRQRTRKGSVPGRGTSPAHGSASPASSPTNSRDAPSDVTHDHTATSPSEYRHRSSGSAMDFARARSTTSDGDDQKSLIGSDSRNMSPAVTPQSAPPTPSALSQFPPLSVSSFLPHGALSGMIPPALMSQAAFLAQAGLTSPSMLGSALPFMAGHHHATSFPSLAAASSGSVGKDVSPPPPLSLSLPP